MTESIFEVYKLSKKHEVLEESQIYSSHTNDNYHMRLFRAQRNLYLSLSTLLFNLVIFQFTKMIKKMRTLVLDNQKKAC